MRLERTFQSIRTDYVCKYLEAYGLPVVRNYTPDALTIKEKRFIIVGTSVSFTTASSLTVPTLKLGSYEEHYFRDVEPSGYIIYNANNDHMIACSVASKPHWINQAGSLFCPAQYFKNITALVDKLLKL